MYVCSIMEKQDDSHTTSDNCCRMNNQLIDNVALGSHEFGLPVVQHDRLGDSN